MPDVIKNHALAKILKEESDNVYHIPEFKDMLKIFSKTVERLILEGNTVQLQDFGTFMPRVSPARKVYSGLKQDYTAVPESLTMQFKTSEHLQRRIRSNYRKMKGAE